MPQRMKSGYFKKWKEDYDFRTIVNSSGSVLITAAFGLYNGALGLFHGSGWHIGICVYYFLLILIRGILLFSERAFAGRNDPSGGKE